MLESNVCHFSLKFKITLNTSRVVFQTCPDPLHHKDPTSMVKELQEITTRLRGANVEIFSSEEKDLFGGTVVAKKHLSRKPGF